MRSRDSSVGIATRYGLDGPGIESRWGRDFPHPARSVLGPTQPPIQKGAGSFLGVKRPGCGVEHPPPSKADVKETVELYLYSPSRLFVACSKVNFTFNVYKCSCKHCYVNDMYHMIYITQLCKYHKLHTGSAPKPHPLRPGRHILVLVTVGHNTICMKTCMSDCAICQRQAKNDLNRSCKKI